MVQRRAEATRLVKASPEALWALLADVSTWSQWGSFSRAELEQPGRSVEAGVGAIRRFTRGRYTTRELVVAFEPNRRLAYTLLSGAPMRDYQAEVLLRGHEGETVVTWRSAFRPKIPGTGRLLARGMSRLYSELLDGLATAAVHRAGVG